MVTRLTTDTLQAVLSSIMYQGPATTLYVWAGVGQGALIKYGGPNGPATPFQVAAAGSPTQQGLQGVVIALPPFSGQQVPVVGPGDGIVVIGSGPNIQGTQPGVNGVLFTRTLPGVYDIQVPVIGYNGDVTATLLPETNVVSNGQVLGTFTWQRNWHGIQPGYEFLDISMDGPNGPFIGPAGGDHQGLDTFRDIFVQVNGNLVTAANIPLTPNAQHWWRVNTYNPNIPNWFPTAAVPFTTPGLGGGGGTPSVTNVEVSFT